MMLIKVYDFSKAPVIVLLAMNPSLLNSKVPVINNLDELAQKIEVVSQLPEENIDEATYVMSPEVEQTRPQDAPYGWKCFKNEYIRWTNNGKADGKNCKVIFSILKDMSHIKPNEV